MARATSTESDRAAVYLRVSTDRQDERNQEPECLRVCAARGWTPVVFRETASGVKAFRSVWEVLRDRARRGEFRAVVVYSLHRIARRRTQIAAELADLCRWGVSLVSVRESFLDVDGSPEMARMRGILIEWLGWFAEGERDELVARTNAGLSRIKAEIAARGSYVSKAGRRITRLGRPAYGAACRARAAELRAAGWSFRRVAAELRVGETTLREWEAASKAARLAAAA